MDQYHDLVQSVLKTGTYKQPRTDVATIAGFSKHYEVDLTDGYPLVTTKDLSGSRWNSLVHEFLWYLSGEEHIRTLREETGIWDAWADDGGRLDTAYGRFWRRYPVPEGTAQLSGEAWPEDATPWVRTETTPDGDSRQVFDQLQYILDTLADTPESRRIVLNAWHPANAAVSTLPPCHYTAAFNVQDGRLHLHLTQRSGDIALGVPFNIAAYALLATVVAQRTGLESGRFAHTIVDAHVYCGASEPGARGAWYEDALPELQDRLRAASAPHEYEAIADWIEANAAPEPADHEQADHVPGLLRQVARTPRDRPEIDVADVPIDALTADDITLSGYDPAPAISFGVAE